MTKVLFVLHKKPDAIPGGTELHTLDLIKGLLLESFHIYLLFPGSSGLVLRDYNEAVIKETTYDAETVMPEDLRNKSAEWALERILDDFSIDIVHFQHLYGLPISFVDIAKHHGCKTIISFHDYFYWCPNYNLLNYNSSRVFFCYFEKDDDKCFRCLNHLAYSISHAYNKKRREYIAHLFKSTDKFIFPSSYAMNIFLALYSDLQSNKCLVIEHGIRKKAYTNGNIHGSKTTPPQNLVSHVSSKGLNDQTSRLPDYKQNSAANRLNVAFLGNFTLEKGAYYYRQIANHFLDDERFAFYIIGSADSSFAHKEIKNLRFLGSYNRELLSKISMENMIDVFTLLSPWPEVYSYTLSEAICNNIPVIANDLGALRERMSRYMVGYLVPHENPVHRIVQILEDIIANPVILDYFRKRCTQSSKEIPDIDGMITKYEEMYREIGNL